MSTLLFFLRIPFKTAYNKNPIFQMYSKHPQQETGLVLLCYLLVIGCMNDTWRDILLNIFLINFLDEINANFYLYFMKRIEPYLIFEDYISINHRHLNSFIPVTS